MIAIIIKAKVYVTHQGQRLRWITQTEALIIIAIMRKPNPIPGIVLLRIFLSCTGDSTMTKLIKLLVSVLVDVTST